MTPVQTMMQSWHDFHMLIGTASATLIGLLFVAASVGTGFQHEKHEAAIGAFVTPSVVHFACVLGACLIMLAPIPAWDYVGALVGAVGLAGLCYAGFVLRHMINHGFHRAIDREDRTWYALLPIAGHSALLAAGILFWNASPHGCAVLACGLGLLMLAGIRNAWDMTVFWMTRKRG